MIGWRGKGARTRILMTVAVLFSFWGTGFVGEPWAAQEETYKGLKIFSEIIEEIEKNYVDPVDTTKLMEKAIQGMVNSLDPHSVFLSPEDYQELQEGTKGEFGGIGIQVSTKNNVLTVISPIEGTPAFRAGIKAGDIIVKVDGLSTRDMKPFEAIKMMRGKKGDPVTITVMRKGEKEPIDFNLIRDDIPIESVKYATLKPGYGYLRVFNFRENTTQEIEAALVALESAKEPLKGLVLDLRNNPGGLLNQAVTVSDLFIEEGVIVSIKGRRDMNSSVFEAHPDEVRRGYPMVVLINGGSASASEIVAGALQDHKRALILGTTSFGKASVQTVKPLKDGYGLKYTIARYYTPNGTSIQAQGIEPDIPMGFKLEDSDRTEDPLFPVKEKDLKNHIEAKSFGNEDVGKGVDKKKTNKETGGEKKADPVGNGVNIEELLRDNQVKRAFDLLIGHDMFRKLGAR